MNHLCIRVLVPMALVAASCTTPEVTPTMGVPAPMASKPEVSTADAARAKAPAPPEPSPREPVTPEPARADTPTPWGSPLLVGGKSPGLRWTTTAQVERTATTLQLAIDVELHNTARAPIKVSLHPPLASIMATPAPGSDGMGLGLGIRGEGMGSDVCSPGHGGPTIVPAGGRASVQRKVVELDPLPWPPGQAYRITASSRDCRPDRLVIEVLDAIVLQPASPDGVPSLVAASASGPRP